MSNVYEIASQEDIYDAASAWIAKLDRTLTETEETDLTSWLAENPAHKDVLFEMAALWDRMDSLSRLSGLFSAPTKTKKNTQLPFYGSIAASFLVAIIGVWGLVTFAPEAMPSWAVNSQASNANGVYETGVGEHSTVNLPDGSQLVLNTNSLVKVHYTGNARLLLLERGEVHINVAHDSDRPLSVLANNKVVQAVGTAFNVQIYNETEVELIVTEGKVVVAERLLEEELSAIAQQSIKDASLAVAKGEKIVLGARNASVDKIKEADIQVNLSWRQGNLIFRGETLEEAMKEISRYTDVEFELADDKIKNVRIAGLFKAGDIKGLLATLEQNFKIDHEQLGRSRVRLKSI